jgi:hypothetical protein
MHRNAPVGQAATLSYPIRGGGTKTARNSAGCWSRSYAKSYSTIFCCAIRDSHVRMAEDYLAPIPPAGSAMASRILAVFVYWTNSQACPPLTVQTCAKGTEMPRPAFLYRTGIGAGQQSDRRRAAKPFQSFATRKSSLRPVPRRIFRFVGDAGLRTRRSGVRISQGAPFPFKHLRATSRLSMLGPVGPSWVQYKVQSDLQRPSHQTRS